MYFVFICDVSCVLFVMEVSTCFDRGASCYYVRRVFLDLLAWVCSVTNTPSQTSSSSQTASNSRTASITSSTTATPTSECFSISNSAVAAT